MQGVTDGGAKACIAEIRWRQGAEAEGFVDEMDLEGLWCVQLPPCYTGLGDWLRTCHLRNTLAALSVHTFIGGIRLFSFSFEL